jgi:hypothetical protein
MVFEPFSKVMDAVLRIGERSSVLRLLQGFDACTLLPAGLLSTV